MHCLLLIDCWETPNCFYQFHLHGCICLLAETFQETIKILCTFTQFVFQKTLNEGWKFWFRITINQVCTLLCTLKAVLNNSWRAEKLICGNYRKVFNSAKKENKNYENTLMNFQLFGQPRLEILICNFSTEYSSIWKRKSNLICLIPCLWGFNRIDLRSQM